MSRFMRGYLQRLKPYVPGEQPPDMDRMIKLNTNENPYPPSEAVIRTINGEEAKLLRLYSDPDCRELTAQIAKVYGVEGKNVFAGNGSDEVLAFAFFAFGEGGAAFADLCYGFYPVFCGLFGIDYEIIPLRYDFTQAPEDYRDVKGAVFISNPNAPTGVAMSLEALEEIITQNKDRLVVADEAYVDFGGQSAVPLTKKYDNLLVIQTFSKSRSLAGGRLGFAIGDSEIIADMNKLKFSFNPYSINRLSSAAGVCALQDEAYMKECTGRIIKTRARLTKELRAMGFNVPESSANFVFAGQREGLSGKTLYESLKKRGILVRYFDIDRIKSYVRITVGTDEQTDILIKNIREILSAEGL